MDNSFGVNSQRLIDNFNQRLELIVTEHTQALEVLSADALLRDLETFRHPPLRTYQRVLRWLGRWLAPNLTFGLGRELYQAPLTEDSDEVVEGVYRVITTDEDTKGWERGQ
jgi:hypothetical protein